VSDRDATAPGDPTPAADAVEGEAAEGDTLDRLGELLRAQGGLIAGLASADDALQNDGAARVRARARSPIKKSRTTPSPAQIAAAGPRAAEHRAEYELLLETIYEGYLLHYGTPRVARCADSDLGLLAGDQLYALGLARLVALGDIDAVAELADVISLTALAHGAEQPELAAAVWDAGARAIGWGAGEDYRAAKALARRCDPAALAAMRTSAAR
jgi:hypothetical protein